MPAEARTGTVESTVSAGGRRADAFRGKAGEETLRRSRVGHKDEESRVSESGDRRKPPERCVLCDRNASKIEENADGGHREVKTFQVAGIGLKIGFWRFRGEVAEQRSPRGRKSGIYRSSRSRFCGFIAVWCAENCKIAQFGFCKPLALRQLRLFLKKCLPKGRAPFPRAGRRQVRDSPEGKCPVRNFSSLFPKGEKKKGRTARAALPCTNPVRIYYFFRNLSSSPFVARVTVSPS